MKPEHVETLASLFDGERVDPVALADALGDEEAPALLADFAALRLMAVEDVERPGDDFYAGMAPVLRRHRWREAWKSALRPALAACLLLLAGLAGYSLGSRQDVRPSIARAPDASPSAPAPPVQVPAAARPTPVTSPESVVVAARPASGRPAPPSRIDLRLRFAHWSQSPTATGQPH
jgi:hypothetical protein